MVTFWQFVLLHLWILHRHKASKSWNESIYEISGSLLITLSHEEWRSWQMVGSTRSLWYMLIEFGRMNARLPPLNGLCHTSNMEKILNRGYSKIQENEKSTWSHIQIFYHLLLQFHIPKNCLSQYHLLKIWRVRMTIVNLHNLSLVILTRKRINHTFQTSRTRMTWLEISGWRSLMQSF